MSDHGVKFETCTTKKIAHLGSTTFTAFCVSDLVTRTQPVALKDPKPNIALSQLKSWLAIIRMS